MVTMQKEKVNTHFSFPLKLDMSGYVEKTLLPQQYQEGIDAKKNFTEDGVAMSDAAAVAAAAVDDDFDAYSDQLEYNLIGVTVHTGNADGGHYYSFIKERNALHGPQQDRWFLFNDAEVKQFDPSQIEAECFGGEMTSKTYDTVTEKYLDFSFEKTNSAYMLFYERCPSSNGRTKEDQRSQTCSIDATTDEQQACCSTDISASPASAEVTINSVGVATLPPPSPLLPPTTSLPPKIESLETESPADLAIVHNKCDIDNNKCDINCNGRNSPATATMTPTGTITIAPITEQSKITPTGGGGGAAATRNLLSKELEEWIWEDNRYFLQDRNIFEHTYFK